MMGSRDFLKVLISYLPSVGTFTTSLAPLNYEMHSPSYIFLKILYSKRLLPSSITYQDRQQLRRLEFRPWILYTVFLHLPAGDWCKCECGTGSHHHKTSSKQWTERRLTNLRPEELKIFQEIKLDYKTVVKKTCWLNCRLELEETSINDYIEKCRKENCFLIWFYFISVSLEF